MPASGLTGGSFSVPLIVPPIVGKLAGIIPRAIQACFDRNILSVAVVKYTIWWVTSVVLEGDFPERRRARAPTMSMDPLFAAVIFMETGMR